MTRVLCKALDWLHFWHLAIDCMGLSEKGRPAKIPFVCPGPFCLPFTLHGLSGVPLPTGAHDRIRFQYDSTLRGQGGTGVRISSLDYCWDRLSLEAITFGADQDFIHAH